MAGMSIKYLFYLAVLLIVVVYFVGSSTLTAAIGNTLVKIGYAFTGRTASGQFANYPGGASLPNGVV
jgi:hypothetical protein